MSKLAEMDSCVDAPAAQAEHGPSFALLCGAALRTQYGNAVTAAGHRVRVVHTIEALLEECVQEPPLGILLDMHAMTRLGAMATAPLFELDIDWPILRCTLSPDRGANFMSVDPMRFGVLNEALDEIAAGDASWRREGRARGALRLKVACRLLVRRQGDTAWLAANCLDLSVDGLFAVTYEPFVAGQRVDIELHDLAASPLPLTGQIVRVRRWDESTDLPGIGVRLERRSVTDDFKRLLARPEMIRSLLRASQRPDVPVESSLDEPIEEGQA